MSIGLIVLALAFVFFLVVAYFAAQSWHWGHVVAMGFLFLFSLLFLFMAATLMRTQAKYRPQYANAMRDYQGQVDRQRELTFGPSAEPAGEGTLVGERRLSQVQQATSGRRWSNVFAQVTPQEIVLDMRGWTNEACQRVGQESDLDDPIEPEPDPTLSGDDGTADDAAGGAADVDLAGHGVLQDQYVYAFQEYPVKALTPDEKAHYFGTPSLSGSEFTDEDEKGVCRVPGAYLGKFLVTKSTADRLIVQPAGQLTKGQVGQLNKGPKGWVLFEKLPTDASELFAGIEPGKLPGMMPLKRFLDRGIRVPEAAYRVMLEQYGADGSDRVAGANNPLRIMQEIEFVKDHSMPVDLAVDGDLPNDDELFTADGRAKTKSLMQNGPATFAVGDTVTVDGSLARKLIGEGFAKAVGKPRFARQLKDYQYLLDAFQRQFSRVAADKNLAQDQVNDLDASLKRLREQLDKHTEELRLLDADNKGFAIESEQLKTFRKMLEQRLAILKGEVQTRSFVAR